MPEFVNPFTGVVPGRKLTKSELVRTIRLTLSAEEEAVHLYEAIADATEDDLARSVLHDIANEERVHAGEFQRLLNILMPDEEAFLAEGAVEVDAMAKQVGSGSKMQAESGEASAIPTVGNMKE